MDNFICLRGQKNWLFLRGSHCGEVAVSGGLSVITIQYKFYCQLPMGAFQRQVLIVQVIKKKKVSQIDY